jgi:hypothetical protein
MIKLHLRAGLTSNMTKNTQIVYGGRIVTNYSMKIIKASELVETTHVNAFSPQLTIKA